jgi:hypothetical protein
MEPGGFMGFPVVDVKLAPAVIALGSIESEQA